MTPPLVDNVPANDFRNRASLNAWRKAMFGDPEKVPSHVSGPVRQASEALTVGLSKVAALAGDPTRTPVARHEAAKIWADRTIATILDSKGKVEAAGRDMIAQANEVIDESFIFDEGKRAVYERIVEFINDNSQQVGGILKIREAMKLDPQIVSVLTHYPSCLIKLPEDTISNIIVDGYKAHVPEALSHMDAGQELVKVAGKYDEVANGVRSSFYNEAMAQQATMRAEV